MTLNAIHRTEALSLSPLPRLFLFASLFLLKLLFVLKLFVCVAALLCVVVVVWKMDKSGDGHHDDGNDGRVTHRLVETVSRPTVSSAR